MIDIGILLVSMPWANYRSPSIQIAALKAFLVENGARHVIADHFFVRVAHWLGLDAYPRIAAPILEDGEALYGALLFPHQQNAVLASNSFAAKKLSSFIGGQSVPIPSRRFFSEFAKMHESALDEFDFSKIHLVGFTLNFGQTLASAYLASRIKARAPHVKIVIGGAEATGQLGASLLKHFPQFDFACSGEGELALLALAHAVQNADYSSLPKAIYCAGDFETPSFTQVKSLDTLPLPDYDEYFSTLNLLGYTSSAICDYLPFETSRGCYYSCSFCSLNLQWSNYRQFTAHAVGDKIAKLRDLYRTLDFFFVDNITPVGVETIAESLASHSVHYNFFYEARVNLPRPTWQVLSQAGLKRVQLGVEALSDRLLSVYNKKSTVLHNLQALKNCARYDISVTANLIIEHPLSIEEDVTESLRNFEFAKAYPPSLSFSYYALLVGSPDYSSGTYVNDVIGNCSLYERAYPSEILATLDLPRKSLKSQKSPYVDFRPIVTAIESWERQYVNLLNRWNGKKRILSVRDGKNFLIIEDWRSGELATYRLDEKERLVYLAIDNATRIDEICKSTGLSNSYVEQTLELFFNENIAYVSGNRALGLALMEDNIFDRQKKLIRREITIPIASCN